MISYLRTMGKTSYNQSNGFSFSASDGVSLPHTFLSGTSLMEKDPFTQTKPDNSAKIRALFNSFTSFASKLSH